MTAKKKLKECDASLIENDKEYTVHAELPGIARKDIDVSITDCNTITIAAQTAAGRNMEKDKEKEENKSEEGSGSGGQRWLAQERAQTTLMRSITLPSAIRGNELKASFKDGLLTLVVPKHQSERIKVEVQDASSS
ncbi:HSP20-like chaperone [Blastocladiella britannica]|nr:HSP20-like chaperone [Blastocladiella britannica]